MPAGELLRKRKLSDCCPDVLRKCLRKCNNSVDIRSAYPGFIGSIRVSESLQYKLSSICNHHIYNVQQLAAGEPAQLYSITVYGHLRQPLFSPLVSSDTSMGPHGVKDVEYLSYGGYGELTCRKTYNYLAQTIVSKHANELHNLHRFENKIYTFSMQTVPDSYPHQFLAEVNPNHSINPLAYGEQPLARKMCDGCRQP